MTPYTQRNLRTQHNLRTHTLLATIVTAGLILSACNSDPGDPKDSTVAASSAASASADNPEQNNASANNAPEEVTTATPRLVLTYNGGILTLDAHSLDILDNTAQSGFLRLNPLGDNRTVLVTTKDGFRIFDAGAWTEPHGDHTHSYVLPPSLKDHVYTTQKPGHVVTNGDRTLLFGDGNGQIQDISLSDARRAASRNGFAKPEQDFTVEPHHGVAIPLKNGGMVHTEGNDDERHSVVALDKNGKQTARTDQCPGVHGAAMNANDVLALGCEDGVVIFANGTFRKIQSNDAYGRIGNLFGSEHSPVALGDYKVDKAAELERPTRISLTNTETGQIKLVNTGASYSFRSLQRGPDGEALVLGTDGTLRKIDPETGEITDRYKVIDEWEEPMKWQEARPALFVLGETAYVTEPKSKKLHAVDINTGDVTKTMELPEAPNEITGIEG